VKPGRTLTTTGTLLILAGLLFSPIKEITLRCWSNPAHWLEAQCEQFRHFHSPWGYALLFAGVLMIAVSFLNRQRNQKHGD
jgi:hypothetical protein